jgi:hypothetical protein
MAYSSRFTVEGLDQRRMLDGRRLALPVGVAIAVRAGTPLRPHWLPGCHCEAVTVLFEAKCLWEPLRLFSRSTKSARQPVLRTVARATIEPKCGT